MKGFTEWQIETATVLVPDAVVAEALARQQVLVFHARSVYYDAWHMLTTDGKQVVTHGRGSKESTRRYLRSLPGHPLAVTASGRTHGYKVAASLRRLE